LVWCISGSRAWPAFFVELGAVFDGGVHDGARTHEQTLLCRVSVDLVEQGLGQVVAQQQAPELQQRGCIGN
jgi:hypothetical protein